MLELRDVTAGYRGRVVLRDVNLTVPASTVVALLGPNGIGKTTLLRVASGLLKPAGGQLLVDGLDATGWPADRLARAGICHISGARGIFPTLSVQQNLRLMAPKKGSGKAMRRAVAAFPSLGERRNHRAESLSAAEQQMLALSAIYTSTPAVVLLDEITTGLAPRIVEQVFDHLRRLAGQGTAVLLVEKFVDRALALADHVYVLDRGRLEAASAGPTPFGLTPREQMAWLLGTAETTPDEEPPDEEPPDEERADDEPREEPSEGPAGGESGSGEYGSGESGEDSWYEGDADRFAGDDATEEPDGPGTTRPSRFGRWFDRFGQRHPTVGPGPIRANLTRFWRAVFTPPRR